MIRLMRESLCKSVNARSDWAHQNAKYEHMCKCTDAKIDSVLSGKKEANQNEKVLTYDMGIFQIIEYIYIGKNPVGFLWLQEKQSGKKLNLLELLTGNFHFLPQAFHNVNNSENLETSVLSKYNCHTDDQLCKQFSINCDIKTDRGVLIYKDITQPGKILSILHEIAHVWQAVFWPVEAQAFTCIKTIMQDGSFDGSIESINKFNDVLGKSTSKILLKSVNTENEKDIIHNMSFSELVLSTASSTFIFENKEDVASRFVDAYIWKEQHAWLVALHLVKQLKQNFVNIEPTLDKKELKQYAQASVHSYVENINNMLRHDWRTIE